MIVDFLLQQRDVRIVRARRAAVGNPIVLPPFFQHKMPICMTMVNRTLRSISVVEPVGVEWKRKQNGTWVKKLNLNDREQMTDSDTSPGAFDNVTKTRKAQIHEERQEAASKAILSRERLSVSDDDEGREGERDANLKDQCPLTHGGNQPLIHGSARNLTDPKEQELTPEDVFYHLYQLEKLYKIGALTEEQYASSRERLWTKIAGPGQSPPNFRADKTQAAKEVDQLYLDRLQYLCQDGAITEKQYYRARDRIINGHHAKEPSAVKMLPSK